MVKEGDSGCKEWTEMSVRALNEEMKRSIERYKKTGKCDLCGNERYIDLSNPCAPKGLWDDNGFPPLTRVPCPICNKRVVR